MIYSNQHTKISSIKNTYTKNPSVYLYCAFLAAFGKNYFPVGGKGARKFIDRKTRTYGRSEKSEKNQRQNTRFPDHERSAADFLAIFVRELFSGEVSKVYRAVPFPMSSLARKTTMPRMPMANERVFAKKYHSCLFCVWMCVFSVVISSAIVLGGFALLLSSQSSFEWAVKW